MKALASYIMRGRLQAVTAVVGFTLASMVIPLFSYLSAAAIALVALRHGFREAMLPFVASVTILGLVSATQNTVGFVLATSFLASLMVLAVVMRVLRSLHLTLIIAAVIAMVGIAVFHISVGDTGEWWMSMIQNLDTAALQQADMAKQEKFYEELALAAPYFTGLIAAAFMMQCLFCLFIARWWQAMLYNPGGFQREFHTLQLGKPFAIGVLLLLIPLLTDLGAVSTIAKNISMIVAMLYLLQGIAVIHVLFEAKKLPNGLLYGIYGFIFVVLVMSPILVVTVPAIMQYVLVLIIIVMVQGYLETWMDLRSRIKAADTQNSD